MWETIRKHYETLIRLKTLKGQCHLKIKENKPFYKSELSNTIIKTTFQAMQENSKYKSFFFLNESTLTSMNPYRTLHLTQKDSFMLTEMVCIITTHTSHRLWSQSAPHM